MGSLSEKLTWILIPIRTERSLGRIISKREHQAIRTLAFLNDQTMFAACNPRRPIKAERIVLNLDECLKLVELLERRVVHTSVGSATYDPFTDVKRIHRWSDRRPSPKASGSARSLAPLLTARNGQRCGGFFLMPL
jgi:hypothetical protein